MKTISICRIALYTCFVFLAFMEARADSFRGNLQKELKVQGFSGLLGRGTKFSLLGKLSCGEKKIDAIYYEWYESRPSGMAKHAAYRLIFMSNSIYLGSYPIRDKPIGISGNIVKFSYDVESGNEISCSKEGTVPAKIFLDNENIAIMK